MKDDRDETLIGIYEIDLKNIDFNAGFHNFRCDDTFREV